MFERWKAERQRKRIEKELDREFDRDFEKDTTDQEKLDTAINRANLELDKLRWRIQKQETDRLCLEAERLDIEIPADHTVWKRSPVGDFLPVGLRAELRRAIDEEKTRSREVKAWWWKTIITPALTMLIGLVGALTGLVALLKRH